MVRISGHRSGVPQLMQRQGPMKYITPVKPWGMCRGGGGDGRGGEGREGREGGEGEKVCIGEVEGKGRE